jgi:hypothetical protein
LERMESQWPVWKMVLCHRWIQSPNKDLSLEHV